MDRKDLVPELVKENIEIYCSMNTEDADAFVTDILYAYFAKFTDAELQTEATRLGVV